MKAKFCITGLSDCGDYVRVKAMGKFIGSADWQPDAAMEFEAPLRNGRSYQIGRMLTVEIKPVKS